MSKEDILRLNDYLEDLYQAMQIGDIIFEPKKSSELYNLVNKLLREYQKYKDVTNKLSESIDGHYDGFTTINDFGACNDIIELLLEFKNILKEVENE